MSATPRSVLGCQLASYSCVRTNRYCRFCVSNSVLLCCDYVPSYSIPFLHPNPPIPVLNSNVVIGARLHHCGKLTFLNNSKQRLFDTDTNSIFLLSTIPLRKVTLKFLQIIDLVFDIIQGIYFWIASYYCMYMYFAKHNTTIGCFTLPFSNGRRKEGIRRKIKLWFRTKYSLRFSYCLVSIRRI